MSTAQQHARKELPKVCKQFPEEFFLQRQRTVQSTLNTIGKGENEQFSDYDQIVKGVNNANTQMNNKVSINNQLTLHKNYQTLQQNNGFYNQPQNLESTYSVLNNRRNPSQPLCYQQPNNIKLMGERQITQLSRQQSFHGLNQNGQMNFRAGQINNNQSHEKQCIVVPSNQDFFNIPTTEDIFPLSSKNTSTSALTQVQVQGNKEGEEEVNKDDLQDSLDRIQLSPLDILNDQQSQLQKQQNNEIVENNNICKTSESRRNCSNNLNFNVHNKSYSSSSTKRIETKNKKKGLGFSPSVSQLDLRLNQNINSDSLNNIISRKNNQFILHSEYNNNKEINRTFENDTPQKLFYSNQNSKIIISEQLYQDPSTNNQVNNQQAISAGIYYNQTRASSSSACFQSENNAFENKSFNHIPYICLPHGQSQQINKQWPILSQSSKHSLIKQQQLFGKNNLTEVNNSAQQQNLNYLPCSSSSQTSTNQSTQSTFRLPRISFANDIKISNSNNNNIIKNLLNDNISTYQYNTIDKNIISPSCINFSGISKSQSAAVLNKQAFLCPSPVLQSSENQVFSIEQNAQQIEYILKQRDIKTPSFNTRQVRQSLNGIRQLTEESLIQSTNTNNHTLNSQPTYASSYIQFMSTPQNSFHFNFFNHSNVKQDQNLQKEINLDEYQSSQEKFNKNLEPQIYSSPSTIKIKEENNLIDLNTSFGNQQITISSKQNDEQQQQIDQNTKNKKQVAVQQQKKKNFIQQNFKMSREFDQNNNLLTNSQQILELPSDSTSNSSSTKDDTAQIYSQLIKMNNQLLLNQDKLKQFSYSSNKCILKKQQSPDRKFLYQSSYEKQSSNKINSDEIQYNIKSDEASRRSFDKSSSQYQKKQKREPYSVRSFHTNHASQQIEADSITRENKLNSLNNTKDKQISAFQLEQSYQQNLTNISTTASTIEDTKVQINTTKPIKNNILSTRLKKQERIIPYENHREESKSDQENLNNGKPKLTINIDRQQNQDQNLMFTFSPPLKFNQIKDMIDKVQVDKIINVQSEPNENNEYSFSEKKVQENPNSESVQRQRGQSLIQKGSAKKQRIQNPNSLQEQFYYVGTNNENAQLHKRKLVQLQHKNIDLLKMNMHSQEESLPHTLCNNINTKEQVQQIAQNTEDAIKLQKQNKINNPKLEGNNHIQQQRKDSKLLQLAK